MKSKIKLLRDQSRLREIYDLRVRAWENSPSKNMINKTLFPNGWFDSADKDSLIWYLANNQNEFIATARLSYLENLNQLLDIGIDTKNLSIPINEPFGLLSRLAIEKNYRGKGIAQSFDEIRIEKLKEDGLKYALVRVNDKRVPKLEELGFKHISKVKFQPSPLGQKELLNLMFLTLETGY